MGQRLAEVQAEVSALHAGKHAALTKTGASSV